MSALPRPVGRPLLMTVTLLVAGCGDPVDVTAPTVFITSPATGIAVSHGTPLRLAGSATDPQDGALPDDALVWTSSIDGELGTGPEVDFEAPSVGLHTLTLSATDRDGNVGSASVSVSVEQLAFLDGTIDDPQIGIVVNSTANAIRLFQLGDPTETRSIALGASSAVTATGITVRGERAVVPLGNAASVAILDLRSLTIESFFLFASGNATGSAFVDDEVVIVANQETDEVGAFSLGQADPAISRTTVVAPFPTDIVTISDSLVLVVSGNLDDAYMPAGEGVVTAIDPRTMAVIDTVHTGGTNPQLADLGPDGMVYVVNTGDYVAPSTMAIIDPVAMVRTGLVEGLPPGSGDVHAGGDGLVYVSAFFTGTVVWDPGSESFVRGAGDPVCAPLQGGGCRGAFGAHTAADGSLYQVFFGSPAEDLAPAIFHYEAGTFALQDSTDAGPGPVGLEIRSFR